MVKYCRQSDHAKCTLGNVERVGRAHFIPEGRALAEEVDEDAVSEYLRRSTAQVYGSSGKESWHEGY